MEVRAATEKMEVQAAIKIVKVQQAAPKSANNPLEIIREGLKKRQIIHILWISVKLDFKMAAQVNPFLKIQWEIHFFDFLKY